jgi:endonuclease YncB( thermonuclease family)
MATFRHHLFPVYELTIVDSDTVKGWLEVTPDLRQFVRIRLQHVEGGELGTAEGRQGSIILANQINLLLPGLLSYRGNMRSKDRYGRLVGDLINAAGTSLCAALLNTGHFSLKDRNGNNLTKPRRL